MKRLQLTFVSGFVLAFSCIAQAQFVYDTAEGETKQKRIIIPYAFSTESIGTAFGLGYFESEFIEEQSYLGATAYGSNEGSWMVYGLIKDLRLPGTERWFVDGSLMFSEWANRRFYTGYNPEFPDEVPGSHDSSENNFFEERSYDIWAWFDFHYVFPWGHREADPVARYTLSQGLPIGPPLGGTAFNPRTSGRTLLRFRPEYRKQTILDSNYEERFGEEPLTETLNLRTTFEYDNRNFPNNPTRGSHIQASVAVDPGWAGPDGDSWWFWEFEASKFVSLPNPRGAKQSVLAFNFWTVDTPSWNEKSDGIGELRPFVDGAPPYFSGATLGGLYRLKAYPGGRFNSRSAIHYSAEYRLIPAWQPLPEISWLEFLNIKWWQFVFVGELGRVNNSYDIAELHSDMHWGLGGGLNIMFGSGVGRLNITSGAEGTAFLVMFGQTF